MILFLHLGQFLKYQTRQKENHFKVTLLNFSFLSEAKTCPTWKQKNGNSPDFLYNLLQVGPVSRLPPPVRGPECGTCYKNCMLSYFWWKCSLRYNITRNEKFV